MEIDEWILENIKDSNHSVQVKFRVGFKNTKENRAKANFLASRKLVYASEYTSHTIGLI